jgi:CRP-like cAMP-binding protein
MITRTPIEQIAKDFEERRIKRRQFVLQTGDVCKHFTFVVTGCFKMYAVDKSGKEHNIGFIAENDWGTDLSRFYSKRPSQLYVEPIEPATILQIKHDDLTRLYTTYHASDHNFRVIIEQKYIEFAKQDASEYNSSAEH